MRVGTALMFAAAVGVLPSPVVADDHRVYIGLTASSPYAGVDSDNITTTFVEIRETARPGAIAEVYYQNASINDSSRDDGRNYFVEMDGIRVEVIFDHDYRDGTADLVSLLPPDGVYCLPSCEMLVEEVARDIVYLFRGVIS